MLSSSFELDKESSVKCLLGLTLRSSNYGKSIKNAGGVELLVSILRESTNQRSIITPLTKVQQILTLNTLSVLCNISDSTFIRENLSKIDDIPIILSKLIDPHWNSDIQSRAAILISDISAVSLSIRASFEEKGCCEKLARLLQSDTEDLIVNTINAIEALCQSNETNKNKFAQMNILISLSELLLLQSGEMNMFP